jgi:asparagine synthetase B (glutamine-hydrolysing)
MPFVRWFTGSPDNLRVGERTSVTAEITGATVYGRPFWLDAPQQIDPDGPSQALADSLRRLDGRFSLVVVGERRALLATDSLGCGPAFVTERAGPALISTHLGPLVMSSGTLTLDPVGVIGALAGSISIGGRTPYAGIRRLRACEFVLIDLGTGRAGQIETYGSVPEILGIDHEARGNPNELAELLSDAVRREGEVDSVLLTAGLDSRAIAGSLDLRRRKSTAALTYGGWRSSDRRGAAGVADALGVRSRLIGPMRLHLEKYSDPISLLGAGASGYNAAAHVAGARSARRLSTVTFTGYLGDVIGGTAFETDPDLEPARTLRRNLNWVRKCGVDLRAEMGSELREVEHELQLRLRSHRDLPPGRASLVVNLTHRQAHYIGSTFDMMHQEIEIATPFFYRPLISYLLTRNASDLVEKRLYRSMVDQLVDSTPQHRLGVVDRLATAVDQRRSTYDTVNWPAVLDRSRRWMRARLTDPPDERIARLAVESLDSKSQLPLALSALPILDGLRFA